MSSFILSSFILIITGLIAGFVLGEAISVLHHAIKIKREEEKNHDRDYKDTQSNKEGDSGFYPVSPERETESSIPGSSNNGKSLDITKEQAIHSRNTLMQYCSRQIGCRKCCFGDDFERCPLKSGPPCMWTRKEGEENVQKP